MNRQWVGLGQAGFSPRLVLTVVGFSRLGPILTSDFRISEKKKKPTLLWALAFQAHLGPSPNGRIDNIRSASVIRQRNLDNLE